MKKRFKAIWKPATAVLLAAAVICLSGCGAGEASSNANIVSAYSAEDADYSLDIDSANEIHDISDMLYGVFFEDINFAADGGLYAEKVANRSFEFTDLAENDQLYAWRAVNDAGTEVMINDAANCLNENNTNYLVLSNSGSGAAGIENVGFLEGMSVEKDANYNFSVYAKALNGYSAPVTVRIMSGRKVAAQAQIDAITDEWAKYELSLTSSVSAQEDVTLQVLIENGSAVFDMISLFPENTYKNRENGVRSDLATMLEELNPKFIRFPGGCVIEGYDEQTAYHWKDSIGVGKDGKLRQGTTEMEYSETGSVVYFGDADWSNYTFTVDATKLDGSEGFLIPFAVEDSKTNYFWNLGGWENTVSCLQHMHNGIKTGQVEGTQKDFAAETGKTYALKVVVSGSNVKCYVDDELFIDCDVITPAEAEAYQVVSTDESGDVIIKLINVTGDERTFAIDIASAENISDTAAVYQVAGESPYDINEMGEKETCVMNDFTVWGVSNSFNYTVPKYSATVIRISKG